MAKKTVAVIRYKPPNVMTGSREISAADFKVVGILTQKKTLKWDRKTNFWIDAEKAGVSAEALKWLENKENHAYANEFTVEKQEVDEADTASTPSK